MAKTRLRYFFRTAAITILIVAQALTLGGCSSLPERVASSPPSIISVPNTYLSSEFARHSSGRDGLSGFYALTDGIDALAARIELINRAQVSLDVQYYIWHDDLVGKVLHNRLLHAADRGVRVRLLLDDLDTVGKDDPLAAINYHPNIEVRVYNPFVYRGARWLDFVTHGSRVNHRMHNKSITGDNIFSILGGRNIGNEYFDATETVAFSDMDVVAMGDVALEVVNSFELYWHSQWAYPLAGLDCDWQATEAQYRKFRVDSDQYFADAQKSAYARALNKHWQDLFQSNFGKGVTWGRWHLLYDHPDKVIHGKEKPKQLIAPTLMAYLDQAQEDIVIVSPYFVPGKKFTRYLVDKVASGTRVRVLTNSLAANDVAMVHAGYRRYREDLVAGGVELYEFKADDRRLAGEVEPHSLWRGASLSSLHGKYMGLDSRFIFVGSFNMDARSVAINTELGVVFESARYGEFLSSSFDELAIEKGFKVVLDNDGNLSWLTEENGLKKQYDREPQTSWWKRFTNKLLSIIVPESQL